MMADTVGQFVADNYGPEYWQEKDAKGEFPHGVLAVPR
jgi:hypothetical protein